MDNGAFCHRRMADWRDNLKRIIKAEGLEMKALSIKAGLDPTAVFKILNRSADPQISTMAALSKALGLSIDELFHGTIPVPQTQENIAVYGEVAAGMWMDEEVWDESKYSAIPHMPSRYPGLPQKAWKITGNSMDLAGITDGMFIVTVDYWSVRSAPIDDDVVLVETRRGNLVSRTCKEVVVRPGGFDLRPRSSDPRHKTISISAGNQSGDDGDEVEIVGLVVGAYRRIGR